jgi:hypothetical protein
VASDGGVATGPGADEHVDDMKAGKAMITEDIRASVAEEVGMPLTEAAGLYNYAKFIFIHL